MRCNDGRTARMHAGNPGADWQGNALHPSSAPLNALGIYTTLRKPLSTTTQPSLTHPSACLSPPTRSFPSKTYFSPAEIDENTDNALDWGAGNDSQRRGWQMVPRRRRSSHPGYVVGALRPFPPVDRLHSPARHDRRHSPSEEKRGSCDGETAACPQRMEAR